MKQIETLLKAKSYKELQTKMSDLPTDDLLELLNCRSIKVGDTASSLINQRKESERVAKAVLEGKFTTTKGKVRASNTLWFGKANTPTSDEAFLHLSQDKNEEIAGTALLALVAMRKIEIVPRLECIKNNLSISSVVKKKVELAIEALHKGDPKIFSPYYGG